MVPEPVPAPGTGQAVGIDRGVTVSAALSTGEMLSVPPLSPARQRRLRRLQRKLARAKRGSGRRARVKLAIARLRAREADARKDWAEKTSTSRARRFDLIRVEDLRITHMTRSARGTAEQPGRNVRQKAGLNRENPAVWAGACWCAACSRKLPAGSRRIKAAFTSQRCSAVRARRSGEAATSGFALRGLQLSACNADVNAARNIAAGHAVTARGRSPWLGGRVNREPNLSSFSA